MALFGRAWAQQPPFHSRSHALIPAAVFAPTASKFSLSCLRKTQRASFTPAALEDQSEVQASRPEDAGLPAPGAQQLWSHDLIRTVIQRWHGEATSLFQKSFTVALALLLAASPAPAISLPHQPGDEPQHKAQLVGELGSQSAFEDWLLEGLKQLENAVGSVGSTAGSLYTELTSEQSAEASPADAEEAEELIKEVWEVVSENYLDARGSGFDPEKWDALKEAALASKPRDRAAAHRCIRDMLARGLADPYSRFITPDEFVAMRKYDVTGVGLNLGTAEEFTRRTGLPLPDGRQDQQGGVWVLGMIKGSAADAAGVEQGDEVMAVDGKVIEGQSPFQVASVIQGGDDDDDSENVMATTEVQLRVRKASGDEVEVAIPRPVVEMVSPVTTRLEKGPAGRRIGYIQLVSFNARAQRDVAAAIEQLTAAGAEEFVLDLKDNRGGLMQEGVEVARLFLEDDAVVVTTEGRRRHAAQPAIASGRALTHAPLTVLVNEHTASASEILAGALHDNCRALLVGKSRTYGKGLIQSVYELLDSSGLVITVGKYLTPGDVDIDREGIRPDFSAMPSQQQAADKLAACVAPPRRQA